MPKAKKSLTNPNNNYGINSISFWASLIKELGIPAFGVLFFVICFLWFATEKQKQEFIDKFFLLKDVQNNPFPFSVIVLVLLIVILLQYIYYNKILKLNKEENLRLGEEKTDLQEKLLEKRLHSSK
jgi:hypothetical protein